MITGVRYIAWTFGIFAVLSAFFPVAYLLTGRPEFTFNGEPVRSSHQATEALAGLLVLLVPCIAIVLATSKVVIARSERYRSLVSWLESEPIWPSIGLGGFYLSSYLFSLLAGLVSIVLIPGASMSERLILVLGLPFMFPIGWAMTWVVLGFQLINPINWIFPQVLRYFAYFFLSATWLGVALSPLSLVLRAPSQPEAVWAFPCTIGAAVAAGHVLRFWLRRAFDISGPPAKPV